MKKADGDWRLGKERYYKKLDLELEGAFQPMKCWRRRIGIRPRATRYVRRCKAVVVAYFPDKVLPPDDATGRAETIRKVIAKSAKTTPSRNELIGDAKSDRRDYQIVHCKHDILRLPEPDRLPDHRDARVPAGTRSPI